MKRSQISVFLLGLPGLLVALAALMAPVVSPYDPAQPAVEQQFAAPDLAHLAGTDQFGRDTLSRVLWGGRISLSSALLATTIALTAGVSLGTTAATIGGWADWIIMRGVDSLLSLPGLLVALSLVALFGPGPWQAAVGVGISLTPGFSRVVRAAVLALREAPYVDAARALGGGPLHIILRHFIPNVLAQVAAFAVVLFAWSLLNIAALEFLGLAGSPSTISWGRMLAEGRNYLRGAAWIALAPGLAIVLTTLSMLSLGDLWRSSLEHSGRRA